MPDKTAVVASYIPNPGQATDAAGQQSQMISEPELEFFNSLIATLHITLTAPAEPIGMTYNLSASPEAKVPSVRLHTEADDYDTDDNTDKYRDLTPKELGSVVFRGNRIRLRGLSGHVVAHEAANGESFTVQDLLHAVEETERQTRDRTEWFGGVDVHHCFFEGIYLADDDVWEIVWGS